MLTNTSLAAIGETCTGLTSIDMSRNENITDYGLASLTQGCLGQSLSDDAIS